MTFPDITPDLKAAMPDLRGRLLANQSLAELTWFRVGGPAQVLFTPSDQDDLAYFLAQLPRELLIAERVLDAAPARAEPLAAAGPPSGDHHGA